MTRGSFARAAWGIALGALALRVIYVLALGPNRPAGFDGLWYGLQAGAIGEGVGYVDPARYFGLRGATPTAQFPPLWPAFLSVVYDLGFGTMRAYRIAGGVVGATTVLMTAYLGRAVVDERVGLIAAGVVALSPLMIAADGSLMSESLFTALVTGAVIVAVGARSAPSPWRFAVVGLLLGLATLTRSDGLLIAVVLVVVMAWTMVGGVARRLGLAGLALVLVLGILSPWALRNADVFGEPVPLSNNSGSLLAGANCDATYSGRDLAGWAAGCSAAADADASGRSELERAKAQRSAGLSYARDHAARLGVVAPLRVVRGWGLWSPTALADAEAIESRDRTMQLLAWPVSLLFVGLAVAGGVLLVRARGWLIAAPLLAVIGAASVVLAASWGNQRFRLVAEPELAVFAAVTLAALWTRLGRPGARRGTERSGDRAESSQNFPVRP